MANAKAKIEFSNSKRATIEVDTGALLMTALIDAGVPVASSCRGEGVCAKCRVQIVTGQKNLSTPNDRESFLRDRHGLERDERISCQTLVLGDIAVATTYW